MNLVTTVTSKGQVSIPKAIRDHFNIAAFDKVSFAIRDREIVLTPAPTLKQMAGFIKTKKHYTEADFERAIEQGFVEDYLKNTK